ncbi:MAG: M48 family metallopeptidase [Methanomassiliicoccales archaeon]
MIQDDNTLAQAFEKAGGNMGYETVKANYHPFKEFKTTWMRSGVTAEFKVSDYMRGADPALLEEFAQCLLGRICLKGHKERYTEPLREYLKSETFVSRNRPLYLARSRNLAYSMRGRAHDLRESYDRLLSSGLIAPVPNTYMTWTSRPNKQRLGYCSMLMRTIAISSNLDKAEVPAFVADYVLYHELLHMKTGMTFSGRYHDDAFRAMERRFPRWQEAEGWLTRLAKAS